MQCIREDFAQFAKSSKAVRNLVEKQTRAGCGTARSAPSTPSRQQSRKNIKIDKVYQIYSIV